MSSESNNMRKPNLSNESKYVSNPCAKNESYLDSKP
jgi:hypothetical protein